MRYHHLPPVLLLSAAVAGCGANAGPPPMAPKPAEVVVSKAIVKEVTDFEEFQGKTDAEKGVDIKARVGGYLDKVLVGREDDLIDGQKPPIREGSFVKQGQVLFVLQEKPFRDALTQAEKNYELLVTQRDFNRRNMERMRSSAGASSPADIDNAETAYRTADSQAGAAKAAVEIAKQNLEWATIRAPFDGRVGKRMVDRGNDVKADDTILTRIVSIEPIYVNFDVDERTYRQLVKFYQSQGINPSQRIDSPVEMGLSDETGYPHAGRIDFIDNGLDPNSGSVWLRGIFPNPDKVLMPGLFARVRLPVGAAHKSVLIPEQALATDQGEKNAWVVDENNHATYRRIQLGAQHGTLRVVTKGVEEGERVIVSGLQRVRNDPKKGYAEVNVLREVPAEGEKKE
ncbi:MAG TPA: efflux RND transporter periplasmic adaptor subunit [Gemmataceae bacterium]|nr:efflux RND transporter periplasmic adaptor subunit [Gemmataceae bacterium]